MSTPELHARLREQLLELASSQVVSGGGGPGVVGLVGERHCEQYHQASRESRHARERHLASDVLKGGEKGTQKRISNPTIRPADAVSGHTDSFHWRQSNKL